MLQYEKGYDLINLFHISCFNDVVLKDLYCLSGLKTTHQFNPAKSSRCDLKI